MAPTPNQRPPALWQNAVNHILGGLLLIMPLVITFWILRWIYKFLELNIIDPLAQVVLWKLKWTTSADQLPYWFETYAAPVIAILLAIILLFLFDFLAESRLSRAFSWLPRRVPVFSHVYNPVKRIFEAVEGQSGQNTSHRLVLVPFPHPGMKLPAFVTGRCIDEETRRAVLCVYVPTTPVPTSGFFLLVPEDEVTELNWDSEQTLQAIISGGLTTPPVVSYFKRPTDGGIANSAATPAPSA